MKTPTVARGPGEADRGPHACSRGRIFDTGHGDLASPALLTDVRHTMKCSAQRGSADLQCSSHADEEATDAESATAMLMAMHAGRGKQEEDKGVRRDRRHAYE